MTDQASVVVAVTDELAPPSQPHRLSTSCDIHPNERFSGFCPSCLCERLSVLDAPPPQQPPSSSRKPPSLKALFKPNGNNNNINGRVKPGFFPELRRSKSFSAKNNNEGFSGGVEPQRKSCDVRLRDTVVVSGGKTEEEVARKSSVSETVFEVNEEEEEAEISEIVNDSGEIVEEEEESKPIKDFMDLYPQTKKPPSVRDFAGSFWSAAKKLQKWGHKQKVKKQRSNDDDGGKPQFPVKKNKKPIRDTQSEIGDYGFGRRSSDTDPRFSLDVTAGRFSVDTNRISLDEQPRASCDGYLIGKTTPLPIKLPPPPSMLSVVENAKSDPSSPSIKPINRESEPDPVIIIPGGSNQTRDYYNTEPPSSSSRRRKSLDRSNSIRKTIDEIKSATTIDSNSIPIRDDYSMETNGGDKKSRRWGKTVATELEEVKSVSNSKVSPAIRDDYSMETADNKTKSKRWKKWSILGFIYRKGVNKDGEDEEEEDKYSRSNSTGMVEERSTSESWPGLRKMKRSNSNVSWRSSGGGGGGSTTRNNKSLKDGENGMLRFYLTPMRSSWRTGGGNGGGGGGGGGWEKTAARANSHGHSIARRVMRLY